MAPCAKEAVRTFVRILERPKIMGGGRCYGSYALQRHNTENLKQLVPEKHLHGLSPNFHIHVSVSEYIFPRSICLFCLQENMWTDPGNIYKSLTDT
jgi:hypothetical protein